MVAWVSIGVYGTYFVLRSVSWSDRRGFLHQDDHKHQQTLPGSVRELGLVGYLFGAVLDPVAVVLAVGLCVVGTPWRKVRRVSAWLLSTGPTWRS